MMSEPVRTLALAVLFSASGIIAMASGFAALGYAGTDQPRRGLHWLLLALGAAAVAGAFGGLLFSEHSE
jgi:hypothetical protein